MINGVSNNLSIGKLAGGGLDFGPNGLRRDRSFGLNGRQAQDVKHHEAAVDQGPRHLSRGWRVAAAQDVSQVEHVVERQELVISDVAAIEIRHPIQEPLCSRVSPAISAALRPP